MIFRKDFIIQKGFWIHKIFLSRKMIFRKDFIIQKGFGFIKSFYQGK